MSALPIVERTLSVSLEEPFGEGQPAKRGRSPKWQQQMEAIAQLP